MDTVSKVKNNGKDVIEYSWKDLEQDCNRIMVWIKQRKLNETLTDIYCPPRGGFIPGVVMSHKLNIPLIDRIKDITDDTLIVDDIEDSGKTLLNIKRANSKGTYVCLITKRTRDSVLDFYGRYFPLHTWIRFAWEDE